MTKTSCGCFLFETSLLFQHVQGSQKLKLRKGWNWATTPKRNTTVGAFNRSIHSIDQCLENDIGHQLSTVVVRLIITII